MKLSQKGWSEQVEKKVVLLTVRGSYGEAVETFKELVGIELPKMTSWKRTQERGEKLRKVQMKEAEKVAELPKATEIIPGTKLEDRKMGVSMDGAFIYILNEEWKEVKIGGLFEYDTIEKYCRKNQEIIDTVKASQISYVVHLGGPEPLGKLLSAEAECRGYDRARERIVIGDGARWIWGISDEHFPIGQNIIDWYHAVEHLWNAAKLVFENETERSRWVIGRKNELWLGLAEQVAVAIEALAKQYPKHQDELKPEAGYFRNNQRRMQYQEFREEGYPIGSGTIESGCKQMVAMRMKGAGMRWSRSGAENILALRASYLSKNWDNSWQKTVAV